MAKLIDIKGIGDTYASKLAEVGINTQEELLKAGASPKDRKDIAEKTGISGKLILRWLNMADLARIGGITEACANLLEHAGVDTIPELAQRNAKNLYAKMQEVNEEKKAVKEMPTEEEVTTWVSEAKNLPRAINY